MKSKLWFIALTTVLITGCAMTQKGAISRAHNAYEDAKFEKCLDTLARAESYGNYSELENARISFQRGLCLEGAGRKAEAIAVYKNLIIKYPQTDLAAQARARSEG
jgi:tetratricopeptide (TPR) repeat protein